MISIAREVPELCRSANGNWTFFRRDQSFTLQSIQMLSHRHSRETKPLGELRGVDRTFRFQKLRNGATRLGFARRLRFWAHTFYF